MNKRIVTAIVVLAVLAVGGYWLAPEPRRPLPAETDTPAASDSGETESDATAPQTQASGETQATAPDADTAGPAEAPPASRDEATEQAQAAPAPTGFCERDFRDIEARTADVDALAAAGGLVHIFEREAQLADPYGCADFYLAQGLDVDTVDPRTDHAPLTGLHFAIRRNDPEMLRFMLEHGADLKKRAGEKKVKPLGYAYYLALNDTRIDRNRVIGILDTALTEKAAGE